MLEALACGVPVVSAACGDLVALISEDNGELVYSRAPTDYADALIRTVEGAVPARVVRSVEGYELHVALGELFGRLEVAA